MKRKEMVNMKRLMALLLAAVLALSLAACGGGESNSETNNNDEVNELLNNADELDLSEMNETVLNNMADANSTYVGNTYKVEGYITEITGEYCSISSSVSSQVSIHAYLEEDELAKLNRYENITIVGQIEDDFVDASSFPVFEYYVDMQTAYLVSDISEITGEIVRIQTDLSTPLCQIGATAVFLDADTLNTLNVGDTITVEGKLYWNDDIINGAWTSINDEVSFHLEDAVIVNN